jgi:hypothetical protein
MPRTTPRKPLFLWSPRTLVERAAEQPLENFVSTVTEFLLVVRLNDFSSELAAGLAGNDSTMNRGHSRRTNTISMSFNLPEQTEMTGPPSKFPAPVRNESTRTEFDLSPELLTSECYVTRIRKRTTDMPKHMVMVGRANTQDITLQHPSVSREHAVFNTEHGLSITDVGSRNHTFVNDELARGIVKLKPGDALKFGAVRCSICTATGFWQAVHA